MAAEFCGFGVGAGGFFAAEDGGDFGGASFGGEDGVEGCGWGRWLERVIGGGGWGGADVRIRVLRARSLCALLWRVGRRELWGRVLTLCVGFLGGLGVLVWILLQVVFIYEFEASCNGTPAIEGRSHGQ